jgi:hypothetical protein
MSHRLVKPAWRAVFRARRRTLVVNMTKDASQSTLKGRPQARGARDLTKVLEVHA